MSSESSGKLSILAGKEVHIGLMQILDTFKSSFKMEHKASVYFTRVTFRSCEVH